MSWGKELITITCHYAAVDLETVNFYKLALFRSIDRLFHRFPKNLANCQTTACACSK